MKPIFIQYPLCGTCRKAYKWLVENGIDVDVRDIVIDNPKSIELKQWIPQSGMPVTKFFNTSGLRYKELGLKDVVKLSVEQELIGLLASEGKLVKRPILVCDDRVLVGFKESDWTALLLKK